MTSGSILETNDLIPTLTRSGNANRPYLWIEPKRFIQVDHWRIFSHGAAATKHSRFDRRLLFFCCRSFLFQQASMKPKRHSKKKSAWGCQKMQSTNNTHHHETPLVVLPEEAQPGDPDFFEYSLEDGPLHLKPWLESIPEENHSLANAGRLQSVSQENAGIHQGASQANAGRLQGLSQANAAGRHPGFGDPVVRRTHREGERREQRRTRDFFKFVRVHAGSPHLQHLTVMDNGETCGTASLLHLVSQHKRRATKPSVGKRT